MSQKGISLIQLGIVIILILILASFALLSSDEITLEARIARDYESLKAVKEAVEHSVNLMEINPEEYKESEIFVSRLYTDEKNEYYPRIGLSSASELSDRSYIIDSENQENLTIEKITEERSYVVDLDNKKYYVVDGIERNEGEKVYEYVDILRLYNLLTGEK